MTWFRCEHRHKQRFALPGSSWRTFCAVTDAVRAVEYVPLDDVRPADVNPKGHDHGTLRASFDRFGFVEPIVRDDRTGRLVAGHGRLDQLRMARARDAANPPEGVTLDGDGTWLVPVNVGWSSRDDDEAAAYLIAANRLVELGGWDEQVLTDALTALGDAGDFKLVGTGYSMDDALAMLSARLGTDEIGAETLDASPQLESLTYRVVVACTDEAHQAEVLEQLAELGLDVRAVVN